MSKEYFSEGFRAFAFIHNAFGDYIDIFISIRKRRENNLNDNTTTDSYEIEIGSTTYIISHEYGSEDLTEIITDYLDEKINTERINTAA